MVQIWAQVMSKEEWKRHGEVEEEACQGILAKFKVVNDDMDIPIESRTPEIT
jgi:hypothetical protein